MENMNFAKENMRHYVEALNKSEESVTLLYDAAAMNFAFSGEQRTIWEGIKAQEEALTAYCKQERERIAEIIIHEGKDVKNMSIPGFPFTEIIYDYNGEKYRIATENGEITSIVYIEE